MSYTIREQVKIRLKQFHIKEEEGFSDIVFDNPESDPLIDQLIEQATNDVREQRQYPDSYDECDIAKDLERFEFVIVNLVVYDYSQAGENYMESYSENGVSRKWKDREKLYAGVYPFAKIL